MGGSAATEDQFVLRPKLIWRLALPAAAISIAAAQIDARQFDVLSITSAVLLFAVTAQAWWTIIVIRDDALFRRTFRWSDPVDLEHLTLVQRRWDYDRMGRHRVLLLKDRDGAVVLSLRWWSNWRELVAVVAVDADPLVVEAKTRPWLAKFRPYQSSGGPPPPRTYR